MSQPPHEKKVICHSCKTEIKRGAEYSYYPSDRQVLCESCYEKRYDGLGYYCTVGEYDWWEVDLDIGSEDKTAGISEEELELIKYGGYEKVCEAEGNLLDNPDNTSKSSTNAGGTLGDSASKPSDYPKNAIAVCKVDTKVFVPDVEVVFSQDTYNRMFGYVDESQIEISGVGRVKRFGDEKKIVFHVHDLFLLKQKNTSVKTHLDPAELANFIIGRAEKNQPVEDIKLWWHSHVWANPFWSDTDDRCCDGFASESADKDNWYLSIVVNKKREMRCRLDLYSPVRITFDDIPVKVSISFSDIDKKAIAEEVKEKCEDEYKPQTEVTTYVPSQYIPGWAVANDKHIEDKFINKREHDLPYYRDLTIRGQLIEKLHYVHKKELYTALEANPEKATHPVPSRKAMEKSRNWYLSWAGDQISKFGAKLMRAKNIVSQMDIMIFYKRLPECSCAWCMEQSAIIDDLDKKLYGFNR